MTPTGRPSFLNDAKRQAVCMILAKGGALAEAAKLLGCTPRTLQREQRRNPEFRQQVRDAKAQALLTPFQIMRKTAGSNWRAASWMIERTDACRREQAEMLSHDEFEMPPQDEEPSLLDRLRLAASRRSDTPLEITPELERAFPKCVAFMRRLRALGKSGDASQADSKMQEMNNEM